MSIFYTKKEGSYGVDYHIATIVFFGIFCLMLLIGMFYAYGFFGRWYNRYQTRMDANNEVAVNEIRIRQQEQLIQVEKQKAEIRIVEAGGIAESQKIINSSLTNNYLQYLAIKAQEAMAGSPNHTQIYIPVGTNGIPLIKTVE